MLDLLWQNRGKKESDVKIFNQKYYEDFFHNRSLIEQKIKDETQKIAEINKEIEKNKGKKRFTIEKQEELRNIQKTIELIKKN